ncbi:MAG TPA: hypothetical protein VHF25_10335 [Nitriliruptorales bacterium]|nr:hypothetical protein [Nitriliruptorales bacterium]
MPRLSKAAARHLAAELTEARLRALQVLVELGCARYSNTTDPEGRTVCWRPAEWLAANRLAQILEGNGRDEVVVMASGRQVLATVRGQRS